MSQPHLSPIARQHHSTLARLKRCQGAPHTGSWNSSFGCALKGYTSMVSRSAMIIDPNQHGYGRGFRERERRLGVVTAATRTRPISPTPGLFRRHLDGTLPRLDFQNSLASRAAFLVVRGNST